jgi:simple sugar transport system permease protein
VKPWEVALSLVHNAVGIMTPFLLAATGGLYTELSGMLNIALEGLMLIGAFFGVVFAGLTGSLALGVVLGIASSLAAALLFGLVTLNLKANVFIAGLATNLLASGLTVVLAFQLFKNKGVVRFELGRLPVLSLPGLQRVPLLGDLLLGHNVLVYVSWAIVLLSVVVIYRTPFGLRLRGTGLGAATVASLGLRPQAYQLAGILISGFTCGLAGAVLTLNLSAFVPNITSGRGWIALVAIYLGNKTPVGIVVASFVFGLSEAFSNYAQGALEVPTDFILAFPYTITVLAMILYSIWRHYRGRIRP